MSWKIALLVGLLNAILTAAVTIPVSDKVTRAMGVSDREGGRGMAIAFIFIPAGFIGGFLLGLLGTKLAHATMWMHFWKALGFSVLLGQGALLGIGGLFLLSQPRPPLLDGHTIRLESEFRVPLAKLTPRSKEPDQIRVSLYAGPKDNQYAQVDRALFREEAGMLVVTAVSELNSRSPGRTLGFLIEEHTWLAFDLPLAAVPTAADTVWTTPVPMREARRSGVDAVTSDVLLRYRVVKGAPPA